jgi:hypothetical protein
MSDDAVEHLSVSLNKPCAAPGRSSGLMTVNSLACATGGFLRVKRNPGPGLTVEAWLETATQETDMRHKSE